MTFARCPEFLRIDALPRRVLDLPDAATCEAFSRALRVRPDTSCMLFPIQVAALIEAMTQGMYGPIRPGAGKTLISLLIPTVVGAVRPVLLVPAALREKTKRAYSEAAKDWRVHPFLYIDSYETQSRRAEHLAQIKPDCLVLDESHKAANQKAGLTRRIRRVIVDNPTIKVYAMTGTSIRKSFANPAHVAQWCLAERNPYPCNGRTLGLWAKVVDPPRTDVEKADAGALAKWVGEYGKIPVGKLRHALRDRIVSAPGVVATSDEGPGMALNIAAWKHPADPVVEEFISRVERLGQLPDGQDIIDDMRMHAALMQATCGYYLSWTKQPPKYWVHARRLWHRLVRHCCQHYALDTVEHVIQKMNAGEVKDRNVGQFVKMTDPDGWEQWEVDHDSTVLAWWQRCKPTFTPETKVNWISASTVAAAGEWAKENPRGIIWIRNPCFGAALESTYGVPYFGSGGLNSKGQYIEDYKGGAVCASIKANSEGRNLQFNWDTNLLLQPGKGQVAGAEIEQLLSRTHRNLQPSDEVWLHVNTTYPVLERAYRSTKEQAIFHEQISGQPQRLCLATDLIVGDIKRKVFK
jgi:hypothetical protein